MEMVARNCDVRAQREKDYVSLDGIRHRTPLYDEQEGTRGVKK